jgi:hypothetical protein
MQRPLSFRKITAHEAQQQRERIAQELATALASVPPPAPAPPKRTVGRPKRERTLAETAAAAAAAPEKADSEEQPAAKRGKYTNWFTSPYLNDVLRAYALEGYSARRAVAALQRTAPDERYARLHHSTLRGWFGADGRTLLPQYQKQYIEARAARRGPGRPSALAAHPAVEEEIREMLRRMRAAGAPVNTSIIRWTVRGVLELRAPALLADFTVSHGWIVKWARNELNFRWRKSTTAAQKLPLDWEEQGLLMGQRLAAQMEMYGTHSSLVINLDQTGVHLVPASFWTYEQNGASSVPVVGAEDKRQITAVVASSLYGDMLPLQLIFQGKTERCEPDATAASKAARVHITHSANHWSNVTTMQQWVQHVLLPHAELCIQRHGLRADASIILLLDVWSVHTSEEFRMWLRKQQPRIHLVYVPANCTSKLQPADVALQRPFKSHIRNEFNAWAAGKLKAQIAAGPDSVLGLTEDFRMNVIKPLVLRWCVDSWQRLNDDKSFVAQAWYRSCTSLYDICDPQKRIAALAAVAKQQLDAHAVPEGAEPDPDAAAASESDSESEHESDDDADELDVTQPKRIGERRSNRTSKPPQRTGYMLDPQFILQTEDSEF